MKPFYKAFLHPFLTIGEERYEVFITADLAFQALFRFTGLLHKAKLRHFSVMKYLICLYDSERSRSLKGAIIVLWHHATGRQTQGY